MLTESFVRLIAKHDAMIVRLKLNDVDTGESTTQQGMEDAVLHKIYDQTVNHLNICHRGGHLNMCSHQPQVLPIHIVLL